MLEDMAIKSAPSDYFLPLSDYQQRDQKTFVDQEFDNRTQDNRISKKPLHRPHTKDYLKTSLQFSRSFLLAILDQGNLLEGIDNKTVTKFIYMVCQ